MQNLMNRKATENADVMAILRGQMAPSKILKQQQEVEAKQMRMDQEKEALAQHSLELKKATQQKKESELAKDPVTSGIKGMFAKIFGKFNKDSVAYAPGKGPEDFGDAPVAQPQIKGASVAAPQKAPIVIRGLNVNREELPTLRNVLFAEISNRTQGKQQLEARTIINTVLNRIQERKKSLTDIITAPQQYQGYESKEYKRIMSGKLVKGDEKKLQAIDAILAELEDGDFFDNTEGRTFYTHKEDGSILATEKYPYQYINSDSPDEFARNGVKDLPKSLQKFYEGIIKN